MKWEYAYKVGSVFLCRNTAYSLSSHFYPLVFILAKGTITPIKFEEPARVVLDFYHVRCIYALRTHEIYRYS
jgi:hypothetical protein